MRKTLIRISFVLVAGCLLAFIVLHGIATNRHISSSDIKASARPSSSVSSVSDVSGVVEVPVNVIPTSEGHLWHIASNSNVELAQCLIQGRISFTGLHTLNYANDIPGAQASVSWITGVIAPPDYFTSAIQHCMTGADHPSNLTELTPGDSVTSPTSETSATNGSLRSYATAASVNGMMLLTFWTQPGAPVISPSPANAMGFRAVSLYKLAAAGAQSPEVVACQMVRERPIAKVPPEVEALVNARYAKLAPIKILYQYAGVVDVRAESVTPHICIYSDGRQAAYTGKVPASATEAIEVDVQHAPSPPTGTVETFLMLAKIPNQGWVVVDEGSSP